MGGGGSKVRVKDSEDQKEMARIAREKWGMYQKTFVPAENDWMNKLKKRNSMAEYRLGSAIGNLNTNAAYGGALQTMQQQGGNISRLVSGINQVAGQSHGARVDNTTRIHTSQQDQYIKGLQAINAIGAGKESEALTSMQNVAGISSKYAQEQARNAFVNQQSKNELIGMGVGGALRYGASDEFFNQGEY